jgi:tetratricopeptide (TPR) repeat protein
MRSFVVIAFALLVLPLSAQDKATEKKLASARAFLARDKPYKAIRASDAMLGRNPQPQFHLIRAEGNNAIGEYQKALRDVAAYQRLVKLDADSWFQAGVAHTGLGERDSARACFGKVLKSTTAAASYDAPDAGLRREAYYRMALMEQIDGRPAQAIMWVDSARALMHEASDPRYDRTTGECYALTGDSAMAGKFLRKALDMAPRDAVMWNSLGYYRFAMFNEHERAIACYDRAIKLNPNYSYAFNNRGWSQYRLGRKDRALKDIGLAKRKKVFNPFVYRNLGLIALADGDTLRACESFRRAVDYGFTALYGEEVKDLIAANCPEAEKGRVPLQTPNAPLDRPATKPPTRTNAP